MNNISISTNELYSFVEIMNELTFVSDLIPTLNKVVAHTNLLIPFERCTTSYKLTTGGETESFNYEFPSSNHRALKKIEDSDVFDELYPFLQSYHKAATFKNTFIWNKNNNAVDVELGNNLEKLGLKQGKGGSIIFYGSDRIGSLTFIQLNYSDNQIENKHLWLMNYFGPQLHMYFGRCIEHYQSTEDEKYKLTPKEKEVIRWAGEGKTSWEIGQILSISERTVKFHLRHIYIKFNVINRTQAVAMASRLNLI
jgi:DNA-binding CsgD family transcriptional regulator